MSNVRQVQNGLLRRALAAVVTAALACHLGALPARAADEADLWQLALANQQTHRYSTLITAQQVRDLLATDEGIDAADRLVQEDGRDQGLRRVVPQQLPGRPRDARSRQAAIPPGRLRGLRVRDDDERRQEARPAGS